MTDPTPTRRRPATRQDRRRPRPRSSLRRRPSAASPGSGAAGVEGDPTAWPPDEAFDAVELDDRGWTRRDLEAILLVADEPVPARSSPRSSGRASRRWRSSWSTWPASTRATAAGSCSGRSPAAGGSTPPRRADRRRGVPPCRPAEPAHPRRPGDPRGDRLPAAGDPLPGRGRPWRQRRRRVPHPGLPRPHPRGRHRPRPRPGHPLRHHPAFLEQLGLNDLDQLPRSRTTSPRASTSSISRSSHDPHRPTAARWWGSVAPAPSAGAARSPRASGGGGRSRPPRAAAGGDRPGSSAGGTGRARPAPPPVETVPAAGPFAGGDRSPKAASGDRSGLPRPSGGGDRSRPRRSASSRPQPSGGGARAAAPAVSRVARSPRVAPDRGAVRPTTGRWVAPGRAGCAR